MSFKSSFWDGWYTLNAPLGGTTFFKKSSRMNDGLHDFLLEEWVVSWRIWRNYLRLPEFFLENMWKSRANYLEILRVFSRKDVEKEKKI